MDTVVDQLKGLSLFADMPKKELRHVASQFTEHRIPTGGCLVEQGQSSGALSLITQGTARVVINGKDVKRLGPGSFVGELAIIDPGPRTASVVADTPLEVLSMTSVNFMSVLQEHWTIAQAILTTMARRLRDVDEQIVA